jgi:hypothetical protein
MLQSINTTEVSTEKNDTTIPVFITDEGCTSKDTALSPDTSTNPCWMTGMGMAEVSVLQ